MNKSVPLAQFRLGQKQRSRSTLARLRDGIKAADHAHVAEHIEGLRQAEALIDRDRPLMPVTPPAQSNSEF
jgi:hypothetical protein